MRKPESKGSPPRLGVTALVIIFILESAGSFILARGILRSGTPQPGTPALVYAGLLAVVPAVLLIILVVRLYRMVLDVRARAYGSRLRIKLVRQFLLVVLMSSMPHGLFLGALLHAAATAPWSVGTREALSAGFRVAVAYQEERLSRLAYLAERDAVALGERARWEAATLFSALAERDRGVASVEIFVDGKSVDFAGVTGARLGDVTAAAPGPLSRIGVGDTTYLRHLARVPGGKGLGVAVSMRLPREIDDAAAALGAARRVAAQPGFVQRRFLGYLFFFWFLFAVPPLLIAQIAGLSAAETIIRPVAALEDAARHAARGDLSPRLLPRPGDELGGLVSAWNRMLAGVEASRYEAAAAEKVAAWRDIAQRLAHELKNPLTPIRLSAERVLRRWESDPDAIGEVIESSMLAIIQETEAMNTLLTDFRSFARLPEPVPDWTNLRALVEETAAPYSASFPEAKLDVSAVDPNLILRVDRSRMRQALENLVSNAMDAMDGVGTVSFRSDLVKAAESRYCRLQIRDTGRGIPPDIRDRIFAPYFTTKPSGTGLGLAITERIILDHGGRIRFESEPGSGTVFYVDLPIDA